MIKPNAKPLQNLPGVAGEPGMIHRLRELFCASTGAEIKAMDPNTALQSCLRKALDVAGISRALQAMQANQLSLGLPLGLVL